MNIVGYLVTMANLQNFGSGPLKDISVRVADVETLANEFNSMPQFNAKSFKETGYYRDGDIGMYVSDNIINYLTNGKANPKDGGLIVIFYYDNASAKSATIFGDGTAALISSAFNSEVNEYFDSEKISERNKRSMDPTGVHNTNKQELSEKIKTFMDKLNIYGRNPDTRTTSDFKTAAQLKMEIFNEKEKLSKDLDRVFEDMTIFGRDQKQLSDFMNEVKNGNNH